MTRTQLSLFVTGSTSAAIERVRRRLDPVQSALIAAHVTLCREDEFSGICVDEIARQLALQPVLKLGFSGVSKVDGHGLLLRCVEGVGAYSQLRRSVIGVGASDAVPHITLAHPRNPRVPGNDGDARDIEYPIYISFNSVALIEQEAALSPWQVRQRFQLGGALLPNQALEPTSTSVTPRACARVRRL